MQYCEVRLVACQYPLQFYNGKKLAVTPFSAKQSTHMSQQWMRRNLFFTFQQVSGSTWKSRPSPNHISWTNVKYSLSWRPLSICCIGLCLRATSRFCLTVSAKRNATVREKLIQGAFCMYAIKHSFTGVLILWWTRTIATSANLV